MKSCHLQEYGWNQVSTKQYEPHTEIQVLYNKTNCYKQTRKEKWRLKRAC